MKQRLDIYAAGAEVLYHRLELLSREVPSPVLDQHLSLPRGQRAAEVNLLDHAGELHALERCVVTAGDLCLDGDPLFPLRIQDDEIGITALLDHTLLRIESVELRGVLGEDGAEPFLRESALRDALGEHDLAAGLDARHSAREAAEVARTEPLLLRGEGTVVGGNGLDLA